MYWKSENFRSKLDETARLSQRYNCGFDYSEPEEWLFSPSTYLSFNLYIDGVMDYFIGGRPDAHEGGGVLGSIPIVLFSFSHLWGVQYQPEKRSLDLLKAPLTLGWSRASSNITVVPLPWGADHYTLLHANNIKRNIDVVKAALGMCD